MYEKCYINKVALPCLICSSLSVSLGCFQELSGLKCDQLLSSGKMLPSECVSGLVEVAGNPNSSPVLVGTIVALLAQLG